MIRKKRISDRELFSNLVDKMLEIAGHDFRHKDILDNLEEENSRPIGEKWYQRYSWNQQQEEEYKKWATEFIKTHRKHKTYKSIHHMIKWFIFSYGLKYNDTFITPIFNGDFINNYNEK